MNAPLKEKSLSEIMDELMKVKEGQGLKQREIADACGVSEAILSQLKNGTYKGHIGKYMEKISNFLKVARARNDNPTLTFTPTQQSKMIWGLCELTVATRSMFVIHANPGVGKTTTLKKFCQENNSIFVTLHSTIQPRRLYKKILKELEISHNGEDDEILDKIIDLLRLTDYVLVVDEGQHGKRALFDKLRYIHDMTGTPVIIAGNNVFLDEMKGKEADSFAQLWERMASQEITATVTREDFKAIIENSGLSITKEPFEYLLKLINKQGCYRYMERITQAAFFISKGETPTLAQFQMAARFYLKGKESKKRGK